VLVQPLRRVAFVEEDGLWDETLVQHPTNFVGNVKPSEYHVTARLSAPLISWRVTSQRVGPLRQFVGGRTSKSPKQIAMGSTFPISLHTALESIGPRHAQLPEPKYY